MPARHRTLAAVLAGPLTLIAAAQAGDDVTYKRVVVATEGGAALVVDLPVSEDMTYVAGTASHPEHLMFSLDGGRRFAPLHELRVVDLAGPRPATAADVTDLRWHLPAAPGQRVEVSYRAAAR